MKKFMCIILAAVMALSVFTACGAPADDGVTKVAIVCFASSYSMLLKNKKSLFPRMGKQGQKRHFCGTTLFAANAATLPGANTPAAR